MRCALNELYDAKNKIDIFLTNKMISENPLRRKILI